MANFKTNIKRGIAVGLIAIMAAVNPLQTLQPTGAGAPAVSKAAETDKAPYIGEVRLAVDDDADDAKQSLENAGYEVIDQDLNQDAGTVWNKYGEQAVYLGFKRTADKKDAIRDMKVMNMLGKYSYSDLATWVKQNRADAKEKVAPFMIALKEYRELLSSDTQDAMAKKVDETLRYIREDDSGKTLAEIFSDKCDEETLVRILVEGNQSMVIAAIRALTSACEKPDSTWLERLSVLSKNKLFKDYAVGLYGKENLTPFQKDNVEKYMRSDLDDTAHKLLQKWDTLRGILVDPENEGTADDTLREKVSGDELSEAYMEAQDGMVRLRNTVIVENLQNIPYSGKTLADFFSVKKSVFEKDITKLYPIAAALSPGQVAMLDFIELGDLVQNGLSRIDLRKTGETPSGELIDDIVSELEETSIYEGVDRSMFRDGAAMTSRSVKNMKSSGDNTSISNGFFTGAKVGLYISGILLVAAAWNFYKIPGIEEDMLSVEHTLNKLKEEKELFDGNYDLKGAEEIELNRKMDTAKEHLDDLVEEYDQTTYSAKLLLVASIVMAFLSTAAYVTGKIIESNVDQLPIPDVMVDFDVESDISRYVSYQVVKDASGNGDLNGRAAKQWLSLYTTTDYAMGEPILADSLLAIKGNKGQKGPGEGYLPLTLFGLGSVQDLVDPQYVFDGGAESIYIWYKRGEQQEELVDDIVDEVSDTVEDSSDTAEDDISTTDDAELTGSNIGGGNTILVGLGGGVVGIIAGIFIGFFIRRKKQSV